MDITPGMNRQETLAYEEGTQAHAAGKPREDNPYDLGTPLFTKWATGWDNAQAAAGMPYMPDEDNFPY